MGQHLDGDEEVARLAAAGARVSGARHAQLHKVPHASGNADPHVAGLQARAFATAESTRVVEHLAGPLAAVARHAHAEDASFNALHARAAAHAACRPSGALACSRTAALLAGLPEHERDDLLAALNRLQKGSVNLAANVLAAGGSGRSALWPVCAGTPKDVLELGKHLGWADPFVSLAKSRERARGRSRGVPRLCTCRGLVQGRPLLRVHERVVGTGELCHLDGGATVALVEVWMVLLC
mmetsp:Transcript_28578/g.77439  ORF Transcript_28578/g.77439 Transcript_28578/m.77439 type:complete len:239 (+) Transcript_28578:468-1184(+)